MVSFSKFTAACIAQLVLYLNTVHGVTEAECQAQGLIPVSVEYAGTFCAQPGQICSGQFKDGGCPGVQEGLPNGSQCGLVGVAQNVYGCKLLDTSGNPQNPCKDSPDGPYSVSVKGEGTFCVNDANICSNGNQNGACPGPQAGLPNGSKCDKLEEDKDIHGCVKTENQGEEKHEADPIPDDKDTTNTNTNDSDKNEIKCDELSTPVSVENAGTFCCTKVYVCSGQRSDGNCPGVQDGLPNGSVCGLVGPKQEVYGCKLP